jgi:hypothetical protein
MAVCDVKFLKYTQRSIILPCVRKVVVRLGYGTVRVQACIDARGHFQQLHSDFPKSDLQKVFANNIKCFQACIDARGNHLQQLL